jgi:hypothetical protein
MLSAFNLTAAPTPGPSALESRGSQFIGFSDFATFSRQAGRATNPVVLTSPEIAARVVWDELVVSWNATLSTGSTLRVEARGLYPQHATRFYDLGFWSAAAGHPRRSEPGQKDADGDVSTDTLKLREACARLQIRLTLAGPASAPSLRFLGLSLLDSRVRPAPLPPNRAAWGRSLPVPERSQMPYPDAKGWCSPTSVSMLLGYWAIELKQPELDRGVPEVAGEVFDPQWGGTGNWSFNMAFAGSFPGLRAYAARFSDVSELEDWVAQGLPVGVSLCYNRLRGKGREPSGHLVVCCGFTRAGEVIVNDPGTTRNVRKVFPRANLVDAWAYSKNTVYLVYPQSVKLPQDRFGHWAGPDS